MAAQTFNRWGRLGVWQRLLRLAQARGVALGMAFLDGTRLPEAPLWVVGDRGLASHAFRERVWDLGARPAIPPKCNEEPVACPAWIYANRSRVERLWARLKEWRAVAMRYEKTARAFMGVLCLAAAMDWLKGCTARP
jgi:transposase